jgi:hypothetical protein
MAHHHHHHQQRSRIHHNHSKNAVAPNNYRHPAVDGSVPSSSAGHRHYVPGTAPGVVHSMGHVVPQHPHQHPYHSHLYHPSSYQTSQQHPRHPSSYVNHSLPSRNAASSNQTGKESIDSSGINPSTQSTAVVNAVSGEFADDGLDMLYTKNEQDPLDSISVANDAGPPGQHSTFPPTVSFKDRIEPESNVKSLPNVPMKTELENRNNLTVMSPITMCFTRMLGAGEF